MRPHYCQCRPVITGWIFILSIWLTLGMGPGAPDRHPGQAQNGHSNLPRVQSMVLAEDEGSTTPGSAASSSGADREAVKSETGQKPAADGQSARPGTMPLQPFVPSEEIPAEQAVDFPVDI
jgi:hypothetical protein